ncbi:hypothetical protein SNE40_015484 [Patella caerulea]|uniref:Uncharacterized protein n=1 Tax=Patella caerulea TaxID=87958 RepID=A0AAN8JI28_PATCE
MPTTYFVGVLLFCFTYQWSLVNSRPYSDLLLKDNYGSNLEEIFPVEDYPNWLRTKLMVTILKGLRNSDSYLDDVERTVKVKKRQRQCYWSVVTCY